MQAPPDPFASQMSDARRRQTTVLAVVGTAMLLLAVVVGLSAAGVLRFGREAAPDPNVLRRPGQAPPANLQKAAERPVMPPDVEAWLKHLEEVERRKVELTGDQSAEVTVFMQKSSVLGAGMGLMNPYDQGSEGQEDQDPGTYSQGKILNLRPQWDELITFFNSVPPPEECRPLADDYGRAINEIPGMMGDLGAVLNDVTNNPEAALKRVKKMQNSSYSGIDRYFARADGKLGGICAKYGTSKWFNIATDVAAGGMLSKGMMGGLGGMSGGAIGGP